MTETIDKPDPAAAADKLRFSVKEASAVNPFDSAAETQHRQRLQAENQKLRELLNTAAGLLFRLEEYKCIQTDDEAFEDQLDHWREIGLGVVAQARTLLNTDYQL